MDRESLKPVWMGVLLGLLIMTSPNWLFGSEPQHSSYDAPWIYPAQAPKN